MNKAKWAIFAAMLTLVLFIGGTVVVNGDPPPQGSNTTVESYNHLG